MTTRMTYLYRLYDADDVLLYVGISLSALGRLGQHLGDKAWAADVRRTTIETFASREEAAAAEVAAIVSEQPRHNIMHNRATKATQPARWVWPCEACGQPIRAGDGSLHLPAKEVTRFTRESIAWDLSREAKQGLDRLVISGSDWQLLPEAARWRTTHWDCRADDGYAYEIDVERIDSPERMLSWTAHLIEKAWLHETNWSEVIQHAQARWFADAARA